MSAFKILNIGFSNILITSRVVTIIHADSASARRLRSEAKNSGHLVDATNGRKTRSVILTDTNHLILSSLKVESLARRIEADDNSLPALEEESLESES
jgi:extracellular matrix regulatory protein A